MTLFDRILSGFYYKFRFLFQLLIGPDLINTFILDKTLLNRVINNAEQLSDRTFEF